MSTGDALARERGRFGALHLGIAVLAGLAMPIQSRINGALGTRLGDPVAASLISFTVGFIVMALASLLLPRARAGALAIPRALRERRFPLWYLAAGCVGAFVVISQTMTVPLLGVALFTVSIVTGQSLGSLLVDGIGFGPGKRRRISTIRALGAALAIAGVIWAVSPRLASAGSLAGLLLPMAVPLVVGFLMAFQSAANGVQAQAYGTPVAATLVNFLAGGILLAVLLLVRLPVAGLPENLPGECWYYLGGPLGCVFIGISAFLVKHLGVLLTGLGMIGGQLVGSLLIDVVVPAPGTVINAETVAGTLLTLAAVALAAISGGRLRRMWR